MRKTLMAAITAALIFGGVGVAEAAKDDNNGKAGPNGHNEQGLCTAYFNGQKNGHDKDGEDGDPGPFAALEEAGAENTDSDGVDNDGDGRVDETGEEAEETDGTPESADLSNEENVYNYCDSVGGDIMGQTDHGRWTCVLDADSETGGNQTECEDNDSPGNS